MRRGQLQLPCDQFYSSCPFTSSQIMATIRAFSSQFMAHPQTLLTFEPNTFSNRPIADTAPSSTSVTATSAATDCIRTRHSNSCDDVFRSKNSIGYKNKYENIRWPIRNRKKSFRLYRNQIRNLNNMMPRKLFAQRLMRSMNYLHPFLYQP